MLELARESLEMAIFEILSEGDIVTLGDQRETCEAITNLLVPPNIAKLTLVAIIEQLQSCRYTCEAGPLEGNVAFQALIELSQMQR